jgi:hypothetical protein
LEHDATLVRHAAFEIVLGLWEARAVGLQNMTAIGLRTIFDPLKSRCDNSVSFLKSNC